MATPTFVSAGVVAGFAAGTTITTEIPDEALPKDIAVLGVMTNNVSTFSTPTDWSILGAGLESDAGQSSKFFWKRLAGGDADPVTNTAALSGTNGGFGRIYLFRGCIETGNPFEDVDNAGTSSSDTPLTSEVTTTAADRLVAAIVAWDTDHEWLSGMPPAGWANIGGLAANTTALDCAYDAIATPSSGGTVASVEVAKYPVSGRWRTLTFALIPEPVPNTPDLIQSTLVAQYPTGDKNAYALRQRYRSGDVGLALAGHSADYAYTPNHSSLAITGRVWVAVDLAMADWTPFSAGALMSKWEVLFNTKDWLFQILTDGKLRAVFWDGTADRIFDSSVATGFTDGARGAVAADIQPTNGGNRTVTFYTAPTIDGPWVQLGAVASQVGAVSIVPNAAQVVIGASGALGYAGSLDATVYAAEVRSGGQGGTLLTNPKFDSPSLVGATQLDDGAGKRWTLAQGVPVPWQTASAGVAFTADHPDFAITDLDVRAKVALADWTPSSTHWIVNQGNHTDSVPSLQWVLSVHPNNTLRTVVSPDGTLGAIGPESAATGFVDGSEHYVRCTVDVDDGAGNSVFTYYESVDDGESWDVIGSPIVEAAGPIVTFNTTAKLEIGRLNPGIQTLKYVELRASIDGPIVLAADFTKVGSTSPSFIDDAGKYWRRSTTGGSIIETGGLRNWDDYVAHVDQGGAGTHADDENVFWGDGGWPSALNTGVPAGTTLTPYSGQFFSSSNGEIIEDLDIVGPGTSNAGALIITHSNVTVRRCRIRTGSTIGGSPVAVVGPSTGILIEDCEIDGDFADGSTGVGGTNITVRRCNIHSCENGFHVQSNFLAEDNYIHDLDAVAVDPHIDGVQGDQGSDGITFRHNNFNLMALTHGISSGITMWDSAAPTDTNWLVENNRLVNDPIAGGYTVRLPTVDGTSNNIRWINNHIGAGNFGAVTPFPITTITEWSGNVDYLTGDPI